jgi:hypothetical protein
MMPSGAEAVAPNLLCAALPWMPESADCERAFNKIQYPTKAKHYNKLCHTTTPVTLAQKLTLTTKQHQNSTSCIDQAELHTATTHYLYLAASTTPRYYNCHALKTQTITCWLYSKTAK